MRPELQFTLASLLLATGITASGTPETTRSLGKRDLSDATYNRLAIIHASGKYAVIMLTSVVDPCKVGSAATMLIFPLGVLGARGLRIVTAKWWWAHGEQGTLTFRNHADFVCDSCTAGYLRPGMHRSGIRSVSPVLRL
jgi:hypothetical protein